MENNKIIRRRTHVLFTLFALLLAVFCYLLYGLQIVHGEEYRQRSQRRIAVTETVDAARGEILDSLGRVLVSNRVSYQVTLDTAQMGDEAARNAADETAVKKRTPAGEGQAPSPDPALAVSVYAWSYIVSKNHTPVTVLDIRCETGIRTPPRRRPGPRPHE